MKKKNPMYFCFATDDDDNNNKNLIKLQENAHKVNNVLSRHA